VLRWAGLVEERYEVEKIFSSQHQVILSGGWTLLGGRGIQMPSAKAGLSREGERRRASGRCGRTSGNLLTSDLSRKED